MKKLKTKEKILEELAELFAEKAGLAITTQEMERIVNFFIDYNSKLTIFAIAHSNTNKSTPETKTAPVMIEKPAGTSETVEKAFENIENEILEMWRQVQCCAKNYRAANNEIIRINKLYAWNSGNWIPKEKEDPESTYSVEVLALIDNGLGGKHHAILQYDYEENCWVDEENLKVKPPKAWQYIYDKSDEKDSEQ